MVERLKPYADSIHYDGLGSVIAQQGTKGPRIMLDAHMDEVGGIIRRVTPGGMMTMQMLGGLAGSGSGRSTLDHHRFQRPS
jgi:putative aminopeptidase FrvX